MIAAHKKQEKGYSTLLIKDSRKLHAITTISIICSTDSTYMHKCMLPMWMCLCWQHILHQHVQSHLKWLEVGKVLVGKHKPSAVPLPRLRLLLFLHQKSLQNSWIADGGHTYHIGKASPIIAVRSSRELALWCTLVQPVYKPFFTPPQNRDRNE